MLNMELETLNLELRAAAWHRRGRGVEERYGGEVEGVRGEGCRGLREGVIGMPRPITFML
jgi:hypothetical protein